MSMNEPNNGAPRLYVLCAGAAKGLVEAVQKRFAEETGAIVEAQFGAVGAMKEALLARDACDVMIVTDAMIRALSEGGELHGDTRAVLGSVRTGVAVRAGDPPADVSNESALKASLLAADGLYCPDTVRATAGIHFAAVLEKLGIDDIVAPRLRAFANGATAMRELAASTLSRPIGCTQITEINYTSGVRLAGPLPDALGLATVYSAAVSGTAARPELALRFVHFLSGPQTQALRASGGFEF